MKKTVATISVLRKGDQEWVFLVNMRLNEDDRDLPDRCYRDLGRALDTFVLHADLEDDSVFNGQKLSLGPYVYHDSEDAMGLIAFSSNPEVEETQLASKVRGAVNAAASIIRQNGGRMVRKRIKPVEQLLLVEAENDARV